MGAYFHCWMLFVDRSHCGRIFHVSTRKILPTVYNQIISVQQAKQRQNLLNLLNNQQLCDVTFLIGPEMTEFKANRTFLAAISPVFKAMLYGNMKESEPNAIVEIDDVDPEAFECVLRFAYMNDPKLSATNVVVVKALSERYQIKLLSEMCDELFSKCIVYKNIFTLLDQSIHFKVDAYVSEIMEKIPDFDSKRLIKSRDFKKMSLESMEMFLKLNHSSVNEEYLWNNVVLWADRKVDMLKAVCPFIRFDLMDGTFFVKNVKPLKLFTPKESLDILSRIVCKKEKRKSGLRQRFELMDTDNDGVISLADFARFTRLKTPFASDTYIKNIFAKIDTQQTGRVTWVEFEKCFRRFADKKMAQLVLIPYRMHNRTPSPYISDYSIYCAKSSTSLLQSITLENDGWTGYHRFFIFDKVTQVKSIKIGAQTLSVRSWNQKIKLGQLHYRANSNRFVKLGTFEAGQNSQKITVINANISTDELQISFCGGGRISVDIFQVYGHKS